MIYIERKEGSIVIDLWNELDLEKAHLKGIYFSLTPASSMNVLAASGLDANKATHTLPTQKRQVA